jgi:hypothetical protein
VTSNFVAGVDAVRAYVLNVRITPRIDSPGTTSIPAEEENSIRKTTPPLSRAPSTPETERSVNRPME